MPSPAWLELLSPLPGDAKPERKPVASAQQIEQGTAGPITGWHNIMVNLSDPGVGLRHVQITLDAAGTLLAGGDHVMFVRETRPGGEVILTDHESIGGRFEKDGSFLGTHWKTTLESSAGEEEGSITRNAEHRSPTDDEITALRGIIDDVLQRVR